MAGQDRRRNAGHHLLLLFGGGRLSGARLRLRVLQSATLIWRAVDSECALSAWRKPDDRLSTFDSLREVFPKLKACHGQICCASDDGFPLDPTVIFVLVEHRRGFAIDDIAEVDQRPAVRTFVVQTFGRGPGPNAFNWLRRADRRRDPTPISNQIDPISI